MKRVLAKAEDISASDCDRCDCAELDCSSLIARDCALPVALAGPGVAVVVVVTGADAEIFDEA